ncbi:hypothetical protein JXR93_13085 [bacterium]|nr:hypothetical protein [bacterium]
MATRSEKKSAGLKVLTAMKSYLELPIWKIMYDNFKISYDTFCEKDAIREELRLKRAKAIEELSEIDEKTLSLISKVSKAIQIEIDKKEIKFREFFPKGNLTTVIKGSKIDRIISLEDLLKGFENNQNYEFYNKYNESLKELKIELENSYNSVNSIGIQETEAINILKNEENSYDFAFRKIKHFIKDELESNEYAKFF